MSKQNYSKGPVRRSHQRNGARIDKIGGVPRIQRNPMDRRVPCSTPGCKGYHFTEFTVCAKCWRDMTIEERCSIRQAQDLWQQAKVGDVDDARRGLQAVLERACFGVFRRRRRIHLKLALRRAQLRHPDWMQPTPS